MKTIIIFLFMLGWCYGNPGIPKIAVISCDARNPDTDKASVFRVNELEKFLLESHFNMSDIISIGSRSDKLVIMVSDELVVFEGKSSEKMLLLLIMFKTKTCHFVNFEFTRMEMRRNYNFSKKKHENRISQ